MSNTSRPFGPRPSARCTALAIAGALLSATVFTPAASAESRPARAATGAGLYGPNACRLVPAQTVGRIIKHKVTGVTDFNEGVPGTGWFGNLCTYDFPQSRTTEADVTVLLVATRGATYYSQAVSQRMNWHPVKGVGDKAMTALGTLSMTSGRYAFSIEFVPPNLGVTLRQEVTIGKDLVAALKR